MEKIVVNDTNVFIEINKLHKRHNSNNNVSLTDCSVWYYAKRNRYTLLTGDRRLRSSALCEGVDVRGIIYVFDELVKFGIITSDLAHEKLRTLKELNPRLPQDEIDKRLKLWNGEKVVPHV